jgi:hypothetical protein
MKYIFLFIFLAILGSCGGKLPFSSEEELIAGNSFVLPNSPAHPNFIPYKERVSFTETQTTARDLDIIYSIDNSGSMDPYIDQVVRNIEYFVGKLLAKNVSFQIALLNSSNDNFSDNYNLGPIGTPPVVSSDDPRLVARVRNNFKLLKESFNGGNERPIGVILDSVKDINNYGTVYREGTGKVILALTNADEYQKEGAVLDLAFQKARQIKNEFDFLFGKDPWNFSLIGSPDNAPCPVTGEYGDQRVAKILHGLTGGTIGRICDQDYTQNMDKVVDSIFSLLTTYQIKHPNKPEITVDGNSLKVFINGVKIKENINEGYTWNPLSQVLSFQGVLKPNVGDQIEVIFDFIIP